MNPFRQVQLVVRKEPHVEFVLAGHLFCFANIQGTYQTPRGGKALGRKAERGKARRQSSQVKRCTCLGEKDADGQ